jgi:RNA polymerase sigma-70 factor (ECF subfamily)
VNPEHDFNEKEILAQAISGDEEAFAALYNHYVGRIYTYVYYRVGNEDDAEDLTARVFQRAYRHICNYQDRGLPFSAWLYRIAHNLVANWHRDNKRKNDIPLEDAPPIQAHQPNPEQVVLQNEENAALMAVIRTLPPDRQLLLVLKFIEGLSNAEIGRILGRSEGAIKSLYHRTLKDLQKKISLD